MADCTEAECKEVCAAEDEGPTPAEIDALAWSAIEEASRRRRCAGARGLNAFVRDAAHAFVTPKGDERTNVIDQGERATYAMEPEAQRRLLHWLEACRLEGSVTHFSERQGSPAAPRCGLMLDYDIRTTLRRPALTDRHYYRIAGCLAATLQRDIDFAAQLPAPPPPPPGAPPRAREHRLHVFFIVKPEAVPLGGDGQQRPSPPAAGGQGAGQQLTSQAQLFKYGFHVLVPGVKLGRAYKRWLLRQFRDDGGVNGMLQELGAAGDPAECLDQNSASVPVLYFGSCKRGGVPYVLGAALEVTLDLAGGGAWAPPPAVRRLGDADLAGCNLAAELALGLEADYGGAREPLVAKFEFEPRPAVAAAAQDWGARAAGGAVAPGELLLAEHTLSALTLHDAEARHLHALLDVLGDEYLTDRNRWRDVVYALANTSESYRPLAVWFSQKCRHRTRAAARADDLDALWDEAVARRGAGAPALTIRSVAHWARTSDPARYAAAMERSYFTMLTGYVYDHGGRLEHYMVGKVLHAMQGAKFCADVDPVSGRYVWYEFVIPGQPMRPGEVWKWRVEQTPDDLHIYLSEQFTKVLDQIGEHIEERREAAGDEDQAKYYKGIGKAFAMTKKNMYNDTFKNGVMRQAAFVFRRRGFAEALDAATDLMGVGNGVLRLGARCELIDHFHEHAVSRFTPVLYRRLDAADPWGRLVLDAVAAILPEPDARDWILYLMAQGCSAALKEGALLFWEGGGQNGKTSLLRWAAKALGPYAGKFNIQLLCGEREDADRPNSAVMALKKLNFAYCEESNRAQVLNVARVKELVNAGEVSARELNGRQETFTMRMNTVVASQYSLVIDTTDHGTWRRVYHYTSKTKFRQRPDPANPFERREDQRFVREYPDDPRFQAAFLALLALYFERLQTEHGGELKRVRAPTIERETEAFRISQDSLHRWICEAIVLSPECPTEYALASLSGYYADWYTAHIGRKQHVMSEVIKELESSALGKYLRPSPNRTLVLAGCRVLGPGAELALRPGEEFLGAGAAARAGHGAPPPAPAEGWWRPAAEGAARGAALGDAREAAREAAEARELAELLGNDDAAVLAAGRPAREPAPPRGPAPLTEADVERLLEDGYSVADVYAEN